MSDLKFTRNQLNQLENKEIIIDEVLQFKEDAFLNNNRIFECKDVIVKGTGNKLLGSDLYEFKMHLKGIMVCPCAITGERVDVDLDCEYIDVYSFDNSDDLGDDVIVLDNDFLDLLPYIYERICLEIPLSVVKKGKIKYPSGDGWRIMTEKEYESLKDQEGDPRLAKLKEFKFDE